MLRKLLRLAVAAGSVLLGVAVLAQAPSGDQPDLSSLDLEELMHVSVVSPSNTLERVSEAPATVIVITRNDIRDRGYTELSQILDDLPGMQMARPYGATYFKDYWRGYRNTIGDPFLLLVDGLVQNHLYFNTADVMSAVPLSNIDRVEVVYGPSSSIYGPNAFMGVINVITQNGETPEGSSASVKLTGGDYKTRIADVTYGYTGDFSLRVTARIDNGEINPDDAAAYEYTKNKYFADRRLWGGFVDNPELGGAFHSPRQHRAFELLAKVKDLEIGVSQLTLNNGYGLEYAGDQAQNSAEWSRPDFSAHLRARRTLTDRVKSTTLVRYRTSDVEQDSNFVEGFTQTVNGVPTRVADFSYWHAQNSSVSVFQDFDVKMSDTLSFVAGLKYEQKNLQKAYETSYGPTLPVSEIDASTYPFPHVPSTGEIRQNRITTEDNGAYVQGTWRFRPTQILHLGVRADHNSEYGPANTLRVGYVGNFGGWGFKALAGNAFQEPNPRVLYGGWTGSGSDPNLQPETSRTFEVSASYNRAHVSNLVSLFAVRNKDTIENTAAGAANLGARKVLGLDYHFRALYPMPMLERPLSIWAYYSHLFKADERVISTTGADLGDAEIGDLSKDIIRGGVTAQFTPHLTTTLMGRWVGSRDTVRTNPIPRVPSYQTLDLALRWERIVGDLGAAIRITNLFDERYFEPGVRDANAGNTPGFFDAAGEWHGSTGFYSSLLPQPGREITFSLGFGL